MALLFYVSFHVSNAFSYKCYSKSPVSEMGLEIPEVMVKEDVGVAEVCVVVNSPVIPCPVIFPLEILFTTSDVSAGKFKLSLKH